MIRTLFLMTTSALVLTACNGGSSTNEAAKTNTTTAATPTSSQWSETAVETVEGGIMMGNPDAKVKLVEYGAFSCSHCAKFSEESHSELKAMVANGNLSFEFRPYLLGLQDVAPSLLAKCNGPSAFFGISERLFAQQGTWIKNLQEGLKGKEALLEAGKPEERTSIFAEASQIVPIVQQMGVPEEKARKCLSEPKALENLVSISNKGNEQFKIQGTPTFILNGKKVEEAQTWTDLKPKLTDAGA